MFSKYFQVVYDPTSYFLLAQVSSIEHDQHPDTPDPVRGSPSRSSVRVRMPPGGATTGFW